ncbi:MAG: MFS transporter [Ferruginibacter sp.]
MTKTIKWILPVIVIAQFFCTSLWFAGNAIIADLVKYLDLSGSAIGHITSAVQFGFISGTFCYAALLITDRFPSSPVFFFSAILAALSNVCLAFIDFDLTSLLVMRFLTGFFLAGIYPVGMKIASDHFEKGLGKALGFLVGALVVGTAFPHLLKSFTSALPWRAVLYFTSGLAILGGLLMLLLVPAGPYQKRIQSPDYRALLSVFKNRPFHSAAVGYFGHMWELYAFWAFVPVMLVTYKKLHPAENLNIPALSFLIIACGGLACIISGYISQQFGTKRTASTALLLSGICCIASPIAFYLPPIPFLAFLIFWGLVVIADSPLFSTLVAQNAVVHIKGTAITLITCIGFFITIVSIELLNYLFSHYNPQYIFMMLALGPMMGLLFMHKEKNKPVV